MLKVQTNQWPVSSTVSFSSFVPCSREMKSLKFNISIVCMDRGENGSGTKVFF